MRSLLIRVLLAQTVDRRYHRRLDAVTCGAFVVSRIGR